MKKKRKIVYIVFALFVIYLFKDILGICLYSRKDETCRADAAIVLGAATHAGEVSPVYRERLNHAVLLYRQEYIDRIIVTGGKGAGSEVSDADAAKRYAISQGIPETDIFAEEFSTTTQENLENSKEIMDAYGMEKALIVSDPLHMKRAMLLAKDAGIEAYTSPTGTSRYKSLKTKIPFLMREVFFYEGYKVYRLAKSKQLSYPKKSASYPPQFYHS